MKYEIFAFALSRQEENQQAPVGEELDVAPEFEELDDSQASAVVGGKGKREINSSKPKLDDDFKPNRVVKPITYEPILPILTIMGIPITLSKFQESVERERESP